MMSMSESLSWRLIREPLLRSSCPPMGLDRWFGGLVDWLIGGLVVWIGGFLCNRLQEPGVQIQIQTGLPSTNLTANLIFPGNAHRFAFWSLLLAVARLTNIDGPSKAKGEATKIGGNPNQNERGKHCLAPNQDTSQAPSTALNPPPLHAIFYEGLGRRGLLLGRERFFVGGEGSFPEDPKTCHAGGCFSGLALTHFPLGVGGFHLCFSLFVGCCGLLSLTRG